MMTNTNCGWYEFRAAKLVSTEVQRELRYRKKKADEAAGLKALEEE